MRFLLDTDTCSHLVRGNGQVFNRIIQHYGGVAMSAITFAELMTWAYRRATPRTRVSEVRDLLDLVPALAVDAAVAETVGRLRAERFDAGFPVPATDLVIAATALHFDMTLVTHNTKDFVNIPKLRLEDWLA